MGRWTYIMFLLILISGCARPNEQPIPSETKDLVPEGKIITRNASELVLTLDDVGDEWILHNEGWDQPNRYFIIFLSKEGAGAILDNRYELHNFVTTFNDTLDAKSEFDEAKTSAIQAKLDVSPIDLGDESYIRKDKESATITLRKNNIVAHLLFIDRLENYDQSMPIKYGKLLDKKISEGGS